MVFHSLGRVMPESSDRGSNPRNSGVPVFRCSGVPVFQCSGVPVFLCSGVPVFLCSCVPVFLCRCSERKHSYCNGISVNSKSGFRSMSHASHVHRYDGMRLVRFPVCTSASMPVSEGVADVSHLGLAELKPEPMSLDGNSFTLPRLLFVFVAFV